MDKKESLIKKLDKKLLNGSKSEIKFKKVDKLTSDKYVKEREKSMNKLKKDIRDAYAEPKKIITFN